MIHKISFKSNLHATRHVFKTELRIMSRYKGLIPLMIFLPILFSMLPSLFGIGIAGSITQAAKNFQNNTAIGTSQGTTEFMFYMLIGANVFVVVSMMMHIMGDWLRSQRVTGVLESLYLTPTKRIYLLTGQTIFSIFLTTCTFFISIIIGCIIFQTNPFQGNILLAVVFLFFGMIPLWGLAFFYGALILKIKEANSMINIAQWVIAFLMGTFYSVKVLPVWLRFIAYSFPPTWMNNGVRSSLLNLSYFLGDWYLDLAVIFGFCLIFPFLGYYTYIQTEKKMRKSEGVGVF